MAEYVIDSSAMLALAGNEPGAGYVRERIARSLASAVNLAEVGAVLSDRGLSDAEVWEVMVKLGVECAPFDVHLARVSAELRRATRSRGLSLGDRACLAPAKSTGLPVLTGDKGVACGRGRCRGRDRPDPGFGPAVRTENRPAQRLRGPLPASARPRMSGIRERPSRGGIGSGASPSAATSSNVGSRSTKETSSAPARLTRGWP